MTNTAEQIHWLAQHGHTELAELKLISLRPLKVDWFRARLSDWQRLLLEEQLQFRLRAQPRFPDPTQWLWTDRSLQQASDWYSAITKARLFPPGSHVVDACCGAGADLVALAQQQHAVAAVDRDRSMLELARANVRAHGWNADFVQAEIPSSLAQLRNVCLHADPDRRRGQARDTRTTHAEAFSPPLADILAMAEATRACIIKLAPATDLILPAGSPWRRAWLGVGRECPQQLLLCGELTWQIQAGQRGALLVEHPHDLFCAEEGATCSTTDEPEQFVFEPHAALYASGWPQPGPISTSSVPCLMRVVTTPATKTGRRLGHKLLKSWRICLGTSVACANGCVPIAWGHWRSRRGKCHWMPIACSAS